MIVVILKLITIFIVSYIIGSVPTGYIIVKLLKNTDIRTVGSGSTGATNVKRVLGTKWFFIVMFLDAMKGYLPVLLTANYFNIHDGLSPVISAFAVILGHSKSVFLNFTGGKSVATGVGTILALSLPVGLSTAVIWSLVTFFTKYVSAGSIFAVSITPTLMAVFGESNYYIAFSAICAIYVVLRHKENVERLINGTENKVRK